MKQKSTLYLLILSTLYIIQKIYAEPICSIGCIDCLQVDNQSNQTICMQCDKDFLLKNGRCMYQNCIPNTYLERFIEEDDNSSQNGGKIKKPQCKSICSQSYKENDQLNTCETVEQCTISYSRSSDLSSSIDSIESIYQINESMTIIIYTTYITLINSQNGQFLRNIQSTTQLLTLYFRNRLIVLTSNNEIMEWNFDSNFQKLIKKIKTGKLSKKSQLFYLGENQYVISSYDDSLSLIYFTRFDFSSVENQDVQTDSKKEIIVSFSYIGCSVKIINNYVICIGQDLIIQKLVIINEKLQLSDIIQSTSCSSSNMGYQNNNIQQSLFIPSSNNNSSSIFLIQQQSTKLIQLVDDIQSANLICKQFNLVDQPEQIRLIDQVESNYLLGVKFSKKVSIYNQDLSSSFSLETQNAILDIAILLQQPTDAFKYYKIFIMNIDGSNTIISTYIIDVSNKKFNIQKSYPAQISNPQLFLTYNDKNKKEEQISTLTNKSFLFIANQNVQSINVITDQTNYIVTPFSPKKIGHTDTINRMVYSDESLYLVTCSKDGQVIAWYTLTSLNPSFLYSVRQNNESCVNTFIHQNKWVVALFSRSIVIFSLKNAFIRYSYPITNFDVTSFISQIEINILLYYDSKFILLDGITLSQINIGSYDQSKKLLSLFCTLEHKIIVQSSSNILEMYQFDKNQSYKFQKLDGIQFVSTYGDLMSMSIDYISASDYEILLGCAQKAMIILNSNLQQQFLHQLEQGFPTQIKKFEDSKIYILFGQSLEANTLYLYFHYAVDRDANTGTLYSRSYSLKYNIGLYPVVDYQSQKTIHYQATMPFSYFSLILKGVYRPYNKSMMYGFFVYQMGKPIAKFAVKDEGRMQYYGSSDGILTFDSNEAKTITPLNLNKDMVPNSIQKIKTSAYLKSLFVIQNEVDIYNIYTHEYISQIKFNPIFSSEPVKNLILFEKQSMAIAFKTKQLKIRNFQDSSEKEILSVKTIKNIIVDEQNKNLYIYGSSFVLISLDGQYKQTIISQEGQQSYDQCLLGDTIIVCKINGSTLNIINKLNYAIISSAVILNQANFIIFLDQTNYQIFLTSTIISVYDFSGTAITKIEGINLTIKDLQIFGNHIAVLTSTFIFIYKRKDLTIIRYFKPSGGGNILGYYFIEDYNLIAYYSDEIRYGQVFYFSLTSYTDDGFTLSSYPELGIGSVVSIFYDKFTSRLNYIDSQGVICSANFLTQRSFYNVIYFEEFKTYGSPINYAVDHTFNTIYIHTNNVVMKMNYNLIAKFTINQSEKLEKFYFKYLSPTAMSKAESQYFIFDQNNVLYSYKDFNQIYKTFFVNQVRNVKQLDKYQLVGFVFDNEILLYSYDQVVNSSIQPDNYIAKISDHKIRRFFTDELILTTEQQLIHIDYLFYKEINKDWRYKVISYAGYDESLRNFLKYGNLGEEKILISFSSGRVLLYDQKTYQDKVILTAWTAQGDIKTNFVKYFQKSDSYVAFAYQINFISLFNLSDFSLVKTIDMSTLSQQIKNECNLIFIDEKNKRLFVSLVASKLIYVLKLMTLELETYLSFPNDQYNRIIMTDRYIFTYSISQINIFKRDTLKYANFIKKSSSENRILDLRVIDQNKIIISMNVLLEVYYFNLNNEGIILIDSLSIKNTEIMDIYTSESDSNILRIVGISDSSIVEKRINLKTVTGVLDQSQNNSQNSVSLRYSCYSQISMKDRIVGESLFENTYNKQSADRDYRIIAAFGEDIKSLDFIKDSSVRVIISPESNNSNKILKLLKDSFYNIGRSTISFSDFSFQFSDQNSQYQFSQSTQNVIWQNIKIESQDFINVQIVFSSMKNITISELTISHVTQISQNSGDQITSQWEQSLIAFVDCERVTINKLTISDLIIQKYSSLLLTFQRVKNIQIKEMSITSSQFYQIIAIEKTDNLQIDNLIIHDNVINRTPFGLTAIGTQEYAKQKTDMFLISIIGCVQTQLSNIQMYSNTNVLLLRYVNSYENENEKVILYNDSINISDSSILDTTISMETQLPTSKQILQTLMRIEATNISFSNLKYNKNQANILILNSVSISISDSLFNQNTSLEGGAIYFNSITLEIIITNTQFISNIARGGGGALFLKDTSTITLDDKSIIQDNSAQIGGGIRIVNNDNDPFKILNSKAKITNNSAEIYGQNIGIYPTNISIMIGEQYSHRQLSQENYIIPELKEKEQTQAKQDLHYQYIYSQDTQGNKENRKLSKVIEISDFRSGDYLPLNAQLLDEDNFIVQFSQKKLKDQEYTSEIQEEIKSFGFEIQVVDSIMTSLSGQSFLNYNQFNENLKLFEFTSLKVNAYPQSKRILKLLAKTNSITDSSNISIQFNMNFRSCITGEIFKTITDQIVTCDVCQIGFYSLKNPSMLSESDKSISCFKCPQSADKCESDQIILKDGYWRENKMTDSIYECNNQKYTISCKESNSESISGCIEGYSGPLCDNCDETGELWGNRYTFMQADQSCRQCDNKQLYYTYFILVSLALIFYLILSVNLFMNNFIFHSKSSYLRYLKLLPMSSSCLNDESTFYMKSLINYLQISSMLLQFNLKSHFTIFLHSTNYIGSPSTKVLADSHCLYTERMIDSYGVTQIKIFIEAIYPVLFLVIISLFFYICAKFKVLGIKTYHNYATLTILFTFFQPELVRYFTEALSCRRIGDKRYVSMNLLIECNDSSYSIFSYSFIIPYLTLLLAIPLFALRSLYKQRESLEFCITKYKFGYFFLDYKKQYFFWEFLRIYIKTFIVVFYTLYKETNQSFAYQIVSLILCLSLILNYYYKPYMQKQVQKVESISIFVLLINICLQQLELLHNSTALKVLEYLVHIFFLFSIVLVIIHRKLNKKNLGHFIYIRSFLKCLLPDYLFKILFKDTQCKLSTYQKWKQIRRQIHFITKMQAQKIQQICETNISKQVSNSQRIQMAKTLQKQQSEIGASQFLNILSVRNQDQNSHLQNQNILYLRSTFILLIFLFTSKKNIFQNFFCNSLTKRYKLYQSESLSQQTKQCHVKEQTIESKYNQIDKVIDYGSQNTINDLDKISQYDEQAHSTRHQKSMNLPFSSNFQLTPLNKRNHDETNK